MRNRVLWRSLVVAGLMLGFASAATLAQTRAPARSARSRSLPRGSFGENVEVIGYTDVGGHIPFKLSIQEVNGRWLMYSASLYDRGWSVIDVTNPADPTVLNWVPGPPNTFTVQIDIADKKMITPLERSQFGGDTDHTKNNWEEGFYIWSLEDPVHPKRLGQYKTGGLGTHRDGYQGGRYVHVAAAARGYTGNIYEIVDISDPANPIEVGRWAPPELRLPDPDMQNQAFPHGAGLHGAPVVVDNLVYLPFGKFFAILDISDVRHPKEVSRVTFDPPYDMGLAVHTVLPFPRRKIVETNSEPFGGCDINSPSQVTLIDVANPAKPHILSFLPAPQTPPGAPYKNFCERGSFGSHNVNQLFHNPYVDDSDNILYLTYFTAGLRIYDIADARQPREIGYFIPPDPARLGQGVPAGRRPVTTAADVLVDKRGYIYLSDSAQGLFILRYTGPKPGPSIPVH